MPENNDQKKITNKFVEKTIQSLIQWMPIGGSGYAFISFLLKQEWVIAIFTFPVVLVTAVWVAYTESVITQFREIYKDKGREDVKSFMKWMKRVNETIKETVKWQLAGVEDKYLQCQRNDCLYFHTEGLNSTFKPLLEEVFVPLELSGNFFRDMAGEDLPMPRGLQWDKKLVQKMNSDTGLTIWDILKRSSENRAYRTLAILALGGYDKTTLLRHITYTYANKKIQRGVPKLLPVLLLLRKWQRLIAEKKPDLVTLIEKHYIPELPEGNRFKSPSHWIKNLLTQNKILIMLDGFDEVKEEWRNDVSKWIDHNMTNYQSAYFNFTSWCLSQLSSRKQAQYFRS